MIAGMRIYVEVREGDREVLERVAWREHRQTRELASYILHQWAEEQRTLEAEQDSVAARAS